jgi:hypothetical protein
LVRRGGFGFFMPVGHFDAGPHLGQPSIRHPTLTEPGTCRMGEVSSAAISISGQAATASPAYSSATVSEPPASTQRWAAPSFWVSSTTAMCEPCCAASTTPAMIIQGNSSSGSSEAEAMLVPAT